MTGDELSVAAGDVIGGYRLIEQIGSGGMGVIFRAAHVRLGRSAAVKVLAPRFAHDGSFVRRFFREARVVTDIRHPHIIDVLDFVEIEQPRVVAYVMELLEGESLADRLRRGPLQEAEAVAVAAQLAEAVSAVHRVGVVHRDLKPSNVFLVRDGSVKVLDFGIARVPVDGADTTSGAILGTPAYMAPEQVVGETSPATDVFAVGQILYELAWGVRAYDAGSTAEGLRAKLRGELPDLPRLPAWRSGPRYIALVRACLAVDPDRRPDVDEVLRQLKSLSQPVADGPAPLRLRWRVALSLAVLAMMSMVASGRPEADEPSAELRGSSERAAPSPAPPSDPPVVEDRAPAADAPVRSPPPAAKRAPRPRPKRPDAPSRVETSTRAGATAHTLLDGAIPDWR